jgi:hypothetical protein
VCTPLTEPMARFSAFVVVVCGCRALPAYAAAACLNDRPQHQRTVRHGLFFAQRRNARRAKGRRVGVHRGPATRQLPAEGAARRGKRGGSGQRTGRAAYTLGCGTCAQVQGKKKGAADACVFAQARRRPDSQGISRSRVHAPGPLHSGRRRLAFACIVRGRGLCDSGQASRDPIQATRSNFCECLVQALTSALGFKVWGLHRCRSSSLPPPCSPHPFTATHTPPAARPCDTTRSFPPYHLWLFYTFTQIRSAGLGVHRLCPEQEGCRALPSAPWARRGS